MNAFYELIGEGEEKLTVVQIGIRAAIIFFIALLLIRFAGRRSFGLHSPFDNVITILLGAILSRSVVHSDVPFFGPIAAATVIAGFHRSLAWITTRNDAIGKIVKGEAKLLFRDGKKFTE